MEDKLKSVSYRNVLDAQNFWPTANIIRSIHSAVQSSWMETRWGEKIEAGFSN